MPHDDVGGNDLAAAWVVDVRAHRVLGWTGRPSDDAIAGILGAPLRVVGRIHREYRVREAGLLEGRLPILDTLLDVRAPLLGDLPAHVVDDRLDRIGNCRARVLLLESVPVDKGPRGDSMLVGAVVLELLAEVTHARVEEPPHHRFLGEKAHAVVDQTGVARTPLRPAAERAQDDPSRSAPATDRHERRDVDIVGEGPDVFEERSRGVYLTAPQTAGDRKLGRIAHVEARDVDDRCFLLSEGLNVEGLHDRGDVRRLDRDPDRAVLLGPDAVAHLAQEHLIALTLPPEDEVAHRRAGVAAGRSASQGGDPQELPAQHCRGDFEEQLLGLPVDAEHALLRGEVLGDHLFERAWLGLLGLAGSGLTAAGCRRIGRIGRLGNRRRSEDQ